MPYAGSKDDPVDQAIRAVEMAEEIERLKAERDHAYQRAESETLRAETAKSKLVEQQQTVERALGLRHKPTVHAPGYYNDVRLDAYLSAGVWRYQIVGTEYKGNEARINVDPDTLVRFASEALAAAVADESRADGYWTCPWAASQPKKEQ